MLGGSWGIPFLDNKEREELRPKAVLLLSKWAAEVERPVCPSPALEESVVDLDGRLPFVRPLPHIAVLRDELPQLFQDDYGAEEEAAAAELRGEHTLTEKFGEA